MKKSIATNGLCLAARVEDLELRLEGLTITNESRRHSVEGLENNDENGFAPRQTGHRHGGSKQSVCVGGSEKAVLRKASRRVIIFSSDSESESGDETEICPTDIVNDPENITFSADINFSLLSNGVLDDEKTATSKPSPLRERSRNARAEVANAQTTPVKLDCGGRDSFVSDSPVFMTLMERLKARKQAKVGTQ